MPGRGQRGVDGDRAQAATADPSVASLWLILACVVLLAVIVQLVMVRTEAAADITGPTALALAGVNPLGRVLRDPRMVGLVAVLSGLLFTIQVAALALSDVSPPAPPASADVARVSMVGFSAALQVVLALQLGVSLSAHSWRYIDSAYPVVAATILVASLLASGALQDSQSTGTDYRPLALVLAAASLIVVLLPVFTARGGMTVPARRHEMWAGALRKSRTPSVSLRALARSNTPTTSSLSRNAASDAPRPRDRGGSATSSSRLRAEAIRGHALAQPPLRVVRRGRLGVGHATRSGSPARVATALTSSTGP